MANPTIKKKKDVNPCVCAWFNSLLYTVKETFINLISIIVDVSTALLESVKIIVNLCNNPIKDIQITAWGVALDVEKALILPLEAPFKTVAKTIEPYTDCNYLSTFLSSIQKLNKTITGGLKQAIIDTENAIDKLEEQRTKFQALDNTISSIRDFKNVLINFCGTE